MACVCGACCEECSYLGKECLGDCNALEGKPFWAKFVGMDVCPIYQCVKDKQFAHCGPCEKLPCDLWFTLKDPSWTDEEQKKNIETRVAKLRA
ncbi:TPA: hypothetical protein DDW35_03630 [Candidatus Sumerlaeota bacterium]|jgi:hypothetical protein|nr:hypothetical protein [Candidatus Sumerlaeota bacterium]